VSRAAICFGGAGAAVGGDGGVGGEGFGLVGF